MYCLILTCCEDGVEQESDEINTLEDVEKIVKRLGGSAQIWVYPNRWVIEDFRKNLIKR